MGNANTYSLGPASCGPCCNECGPKFEEEMSEAVAGLCLDCAEAAELAEAAALVADRAREFRYASRYWLAVRPVLKTPLCELVDERDAEDRALARLAVADADPIFSADRDQRVAS